MTQRFSEAEGWRLRVVLTSHLLPSNGTSKYLEVGALGTDVVWINDLRHHLWMVVSAGTKYGIYNRWGPINDLRQQRFGTDADFIRYSSSGS